MALIALYMQIIFHLIYWYLDCVLLQLGTWCMVDKFIEKYLFVSQRYTSACAIFMGLSIFAFVPPQKNIDSVDMKEQPKKGNTAN